MDRFGWWGMMKLDDDGIDGFVCGGVLRRLKAARL